MSANLEKFFKDVSKTPLLTREQEVELSKRIESGDRHARNHMIRANLRLAISIAKKYQRKGCDLEDLIQESNIGLMKAVDRYDWRRGFKFSTYACWWIKQAVRRHITSHASAIKLPSYARGMLWKVKIVQREYEEEFGVQPSEEELADLLGVTLKTFKNIISAAATMSSLDSPVGYKGPGDTSGRTLRELIPDDSLTSLDDLIDNQKTALLIKEAFNSLTTREEQVIRLRFGISEITQREEYLMTTDELNNLKKGYKVKK